MKLRDDLERLIWGSQKKIIPQSATELKRTVRYSQLPWSALVRAIRSIGRMMFGKLYF